MVAPQTGWEANGSFTDHTQETAFLTQIASDTGATLSQAGLSANGTPLNRLDIGNSSGGTWLIVAMQHGNECAPREGALAFVRDLAYSTAPEIVEYLSSHRIVLLAGANPDGFPSSRLNGNNQDINRNHYGLVQPEAMAIAKTIRSTGAAFITDVHGRDDITSPNDWEFATTSVPSAHPSMLDMAQELKTSMGVAAAARGYTTIVYPASAPGAGTLSKAAATHHAVCLLSETWGPGGTVARVAVTRNMLEDARQWHAAQSASLAAARALSKAAAQANSGPYHLETVSGIIIYNPAPDGYQMIGRTAVPARLVDGFGITADANGLITMAQDARWAIPIIMDSISPASSLSADRIGGEIWVEPDPDPEPSDLEPVGAPIGYRFGVGSEYYEVAKVTIGTADGPVTIWPQ